MKRKSFLPLFFTFICLSLALYVDPIWASSPKTAAPGDAFKNAPWGKLEMNLGVLENQKKIKIEEIKTLDNQLRRPGDKRNELESQLREKRREMDDLDEEIQKTKQQIQFRFPERGLQPEVDIDELDSDVSQGPGHEQDADAHGSEKHGGNPNESGDSHSGHDTEAAHGQMEDSHKAKNEPPKAKEKSPIDAGIDQSLESLRRQYGRPSKAEQENLNLKFKNNPANGKKQDPFEEKWNLSK